jgi:hypothetical protein
LDNLWAETLEAIEVGKGMNSLRLRLEASGQPEFAAELRSLAHRQAQLSSKLTGIAETLGGAFVDSIRKGA